MKSKFFLIVTAVLALGVLLVPGVSFAAEPQKEVSSEDELWPQPITDPVEAVPFSHPEKSTVNPESPLYNPRSQYGPPGTRFNPLGQQTDESNSLLNGSRSSVGHRWWGTAITTTDDVLYTYAHHNFHQYITIPSGTYLFAPTMLGTNDSPLEITSRYWWEDNTMKREIAVVDHALTPKAFVESTPYVSDYLNNGEYACEILLYDGWWYAYVYNYSTSSWEEFYKREGGTGTEPNGYGWEVWEEYYFDENDWPDINYTTAADDLYIYVEGSGGAYVNSSHGFPITGDAGGAPYDFDMISDYYQWSVDMDL